jgi:hypothetical protein
LPEGHVAARLLGVVEEVGGRVNLLMVGQNRRMSKVYWIVASGHLSELDSTLAISGPVASKRRILASFQGR